MTFTPRLFLSVCTFALIGVFGALTTYADPTVVNGNFNTFGFVLGRFRSRFATGWRRWLRTRRRDRRLHRVTARPILLAAKQLQPTVQARRLAAQTDRARDVLLRAAFERLRRACRRPCGRRCDLDRRSRRRRLAHRYRARRRWHWRTTGARPPLGLCFVATHHQTQNQPNHVVPHRGRRY